VSHRLAVVLNVVAIVVIGAVITVIARLMIGRHQHQRGDAEGAPAEGRERGHRRSVATSGPAGQAGAGHLRGADR